MDVETMRCEALTAIDAMGRALRSNAEAVETRYLERLIVDRDEMLAYALPERWLPVTDFEGLYEVSDQGRVRSWIARGCTLPKMLKLTPQEGPGRVGYLAVCLNGHGRARRTRLVHKIVTTAFFGQCPPGLQVRHLDGNAKNNCVENLKYGTKSENERDRVRHGTHPQTAKTHCGRGHEYTAFANKDRTAIHRRCTVCRRERQREQSGCKPRPDDHQTHCPQGHAKTPENTRIRSNGSRVCRICVRNQERRRLGQQPHDPTTCINGHARTEENIYVNPSTGGRHCRTCRVNNCRALQGRRSRQLETVS